MLYINEYIFKVENLNVKRVNMVDFTYLKNFTAKCIYCSNIIIKWNYSGAELTMFCALSKDMRSEECGFFDLIKVVACNKCGERCETNMKYCSNCGSLLK